MILVAVAALGACVSFYFRSENGALRVALDSERKRIDAHETRIDAQTTDIAQHDTRLDVVERDVARESEINETQTTEIEAVSRQLAESVESLRKMEGRIEANQNELAKLEELRGQYASLKDGHNLLEQKLTELLARSRDDRTTLEELKLQLESLRAERAAERGRLERIERILGVDPDL